MTLPKWIEEIKERQSDSRYSRIPIDALDTHALLATIKVYRDVLDDIREIYTIQCARNSFSYRERDTIIPQIVAKALNFIPEGRE